MFRALFLSLPCLPLLAYVPALGQSAPEPAPFVRIYGTTITGNKITKDRIILRELIIHEGDSMSTTVLYEKLERSRQNLMNTGLFNTVTVLPLYLDARSAMVEVTVNERWYLWPSLIFDLADPNFNTWWLTKDLDRVNYGM